MRKFNQYGQAILEIILALGIFALFGVGAATLVLTGLTDTEGGEEQTQASFYAQEGIDAARSVRGNRWRDLANGDHGVDDSGGTWVFSGTSDLIDGKFTRVVNVADVSRDGSGDIVTSGGTFDPRTKLVTSTVTWNDGLIPRSVQHQVYLTDWNKYDWTETTDTEFNLGTLTQTAVDGTGNAAGVILEEGTGGESGPTGPAEWVEGGGEGYVDTTDTDFSAGTLNSTQVIGTDNPAYVELATTPTWRELQFTTPGSVDFEAASDTFAVGENGSVYVNANGYWVQYDSPVSDDLFDVDEVSATEGYAVGENGNAVRYANGEWNTVPTSTSEQLNGLSMLSTDDGWAVGNSGTVQRWNGSTFETVSSPTGNLLSDVDAVAEDDVWIVGHSGTILRWNGTSLSSFSSPTGNDLEEISMISATDGFAVGNSGTLIRWNGSTWSNFTPNPTSGSLSSISMRDASFGFIVGDSGSLYEWNGTTWSNVGAPWGGINVFYIEITDTNNAWAVGDAGEIWRWNGTVWFEYDNATTQRMRGVDVYSDTFAIAAGNSGDIQHWDGQGWYLYEPSGQQMNDVHILSETDAWTVADNGNAYRWNGTTWSSFSHPANQDINAIDFVDNTFGISAGNNNNVYHWNGASWATVATATNQTMNGVDVLSSTDAWIVANNGVIQRWDGASWVLVTSPTGQDLNGISMIDANDGFAVGDGGVIIRWNGTTWSTVTSPTGTQLNGVSMISATEGYASGDNGVLLSWNGTSWSTVASGTGNDLEAIDVFDANTGWAVGQNGELVELTEVYATSGTFESEVIDSGTGGTDWDFIQWGELNYSQTNVTLATRTGDTAVPDGSWSGWSAELSDPSGGAIVSGNARYLQYRATFSSSNDVISSRLEDVAIITNDPGLSQDINEVYMIDSSDGWSVADGGVIARYNGSSWQNFTSPTGSSLNGLDMVSATDGWAVGNSGTIIRWNGTTWSTVTSPTGNTLNAVSMISASDGFAVGASGTIIRWNGTTWDLQASPSGSTLQGIKMIDASDGWIVGNGGTILDWNGTTWSTVSSPVGNTLYGVDFVSTNDGWAAGDSGKILRYDGSWSEFADSGATSFRDIWMIDTDDGRVVGSGGQILKWDTVSWVIEYSPTTEQINAVSMVDDNEGWSVGNNGLFLNYLPSSGTGGGSGPPVAAQIVDDTQAEFDTGTYSSTQWDTDHVELNSATSGTYESEVFDGTDTGVTWDQLSWVEDITATGFAMEVGSVTAPGGVGGGAGSIDDDTQVEFDAGTYSDTQWDTDHVELDATGLTNGTGTYTSQIFNAGGTATWTDILWTPTAPYGKELPNSTAGSVDWWDNSYGHRSKILFGTSHSALATGHTVTLVMDTQIGSTNVALANGNDVRIVWQPTIGADIELDRIGDTWNNAATSIEFRLQSDIGANLNEDTDGSYYVYYNNAGAGTPPSDEGNVYYFADYFNRANSTTIGNGWTEWNTGGGDLDIVSNTLEVIGDNTGPPDAGIKQNFPLGAIPGDFTIEWDWTIPANSEGLWTNYVNIGDSGSMVDSSRTTGVGPGIYNGEGSWFSPNGTENISNDLSGNMENNIEGGPYTFRLEIDESADNYDYYRDDILRASNQNFVNGISNLDQIRIATDQYQGNQPEFVYDNLRIWLNVADDPEEALDTEETFSAGSAAVESGYASGNIDMNGNTLLLHMNEASGTIIDNSTSGNNGTVTGGVTYGTTGQLNDALTFNGSTGYIDMASELSTLRGTATLAFWINTTQTGNDTPWAAPGVAGIEESGGGDDIFWGYIDSSGNIGIEKGNTAGAVSTTAINDGNWHHVALTYDASNGNVQVYIDGVLEDSGTTETGVVGNTFTSIGRIEDTGGSPEYLNGSLDELNIWDSVLSPTKIQDIYRRGGLNLQIQVRSCDDAACAGESFIGPDGTAGDFYHDLDNTSTTPPDPTLTNVTDNQYFQYQVTLTSQNGVDNPELNDISFDYNVASGGLNFTTVNLTNTYTSPVVVPFYYRSANTQPMSVRLRNVGSTSFELALQDPSGTTPSADDVHYIVVEEGVWTMPGGELIEAGTFTTSKVAAKSNGHNNFDVVTFGHTYPTVPLVFSSVMTFNDSNWITTYVSRNNSRTNPPDNNGMRFAMGGAEATATHGSETLGYIVIEEGTGTIDGVDFEADRTSDSVRGIGNGCYNFNFSNSYAAPPIALASQVEMDGGDGGWGIGCNLTNTQIGMASQEDVVGDTETNHTTETFDWMAWENAFAYQSTVDITFQVRSCDDAACSGESYVGPDGTGGTVFTTPAGEAINVPTNQYFQYLATFTAGDASISGELSSVTIDYTIPGSGGGGGGGGGGGTGYPASGTFLSGVFNSDGTATEWDTLYWDEDLPASTDATVAVRVGNTPTPDGSWTAWTSEYTDPLGNNIALTGQYAQYRLTLTSSDDSVTPEVENITLTYNP